MLGYFHSPCWILSGPSDLQTCALPYGAIISLMVSPFLVSPISSKNSNDLDVSTVNFLTLRGELAGTFPGACQTIHRKLLQQTCCVWEPSRGRTPRVAIFRMQTATHALFYPLCWWPQARVFPWCLFQAIGRGAAVLTALWNILHL